LRWRAKAVDLRGTARFFEPRDIRELHQAGLVGRDLQASDLTLVVAIDAFSSQPHVIELAQLIVLEVAHDLAPTRTLSVEAMVWIDTR